MSNWTLAVLDAGNLVSAQNEALIQTDVSYVLEYLDRFMDWNGTLDVQIHIKPHSALLLEQGYEVDGILPATEGSWFWTGTQWEKSNLIEGLSGSDINGADSDAGFTIYLGEDGTIRNYGFPVWLDPNPQFETPVNIPAGSHDFTSIALHEIVHNLAFDGVTDPTSPFGRQIEYRDGIGYFIGTNVLALIPEGLPINEGSHVINSLLPSYTQYQFAGLMRDFGLYEQNRWEIGRIELAVLKDLGWDVNGALEGLPYTDIDDNSLQVIGSDASEILYGDWHNNSIQAGSGNDLIDGGDGSDTSAYVGSSRGYTLVVDTAFTSVKDKVGNEGLDTLVNVEQVQFADQTLNTTWFTKAAAVPMDQFTDLIDMYIAYFDRAPDAVGLFYWASRLSDGMSLQQIAKSFFVQPETLAAFPASQTTAEFVTTVYDNMLGRDPDTGGFNYWVRDLQSGNVSKDEFMLAVIYGARATTGSPLDVQYLANKNAVGKDYAVNEGLSNLAWAKTLMASVDDSLASVQAAYQTTDGFAATAASAGGSELVVHLVGVVA